MCGFFSLFITTVPSLLLPFSDIYLYMCGVQILCDLFIKSSAHSVLTNERLTCIMYLTNLMMQLFIAFSTWCYYISNLRRLRNIGGFGLLLPWVIKFRWPWMNLIHGMVMLTVSLSTVFSRMSRMSSRESIGLGVQEAYWFHGGRGCDQFEWTKYCFLPLIYYCLETHEIYFSPLYLDNHWVHGAKVLQGFVTSL